MTDFATPELVVPGELFIPGSVPGSLWSKNAGGMPNGDDCLRLTQVAADEGEFKAFQDSIGAGPSARADHLLDTGACAMSFWIRRVNLWGNGVSPFSTGGTITTGNLDSVYWLMGVGSATAAAGDTDAADRNVSWGFITSGWEYLQFVQLGYISTSGIFYYYVSPRTPLIATGEWNLVVVNREAADFNNSIAGDQGRVTLYVNGQPVFYNYPTWTLYPDPVTPQRFALGCPLNQDRSIRSNADQVICDIGQLAFHDRNLTEVEMLDMYESMIYGPGA